MSRSFFHTAGIVVSMKPASDPKISLKQRVKSSVVWRSFEILEKRELKKVFLIILLQICLGGLDLLGVLTLGLLASISVSGLQNGNMPESRNGLLNNMGLSSLSLQEQLVVLGILSICLLVGRTLLSVIFTRRVLYFFSCKGAEITNSLLSGLMSKSLLVVQSQSTQQTLYAVTKGVEIITLRIMASAVTFFSDSIILLIMGIGLLFVDPMTAIGTFIFLAGVGTFLDRLLNIKAVQLGKDSSLWNIMSSEKIVEVLSSYRETIVRNRRKYYVEEIVKIRLQLARNTAEINFLPYVSKYVIEAAVIFGSIILGASQFILKSPAEAVSTLAIFLAAGTRVAPSILRLQQSTTQIKMSLGQAGPTLDMIDSLGLKTELDAISNNIDIRHDGFEPSVEIEDVSFRYPKSSVAALSHISLRISEGAFIAIVGPSGAGKTTLVDILLGILTPTDGTIKISGVQPVKAFAKWPGAVSYVPQDVLLAKGSIAANVSLGYPIETVNQNLVMDALEISQMSSFVESLPLGADTPIGERGNKISGGQRQRIGIARAVFTKPRLLVLDEATSSLDGETEADVTDALMKLKGSATIIMIAHRLTTIKNADTVIYMEAGEIVAAGTFEEMKSLVPNFEKQIRLLTI